MKLARNQSGQGMTEYIIIVAVVALAGIAAFSYFGKTLRGSAADVSETLAGGTVAQKAQSAATEANTEADTNANMKTYEDHKAPDS